MEWRTMAGAMGSQRNGAVAALLIALVGIPSIGLVTAISVCQAGDVAVAAQTPATKSGATTLLMPAVAEAEISLDDAEPRDTGSRMLRAEERHAMHQGDEACIRRHSGLPSIPATHAADLSRLCRLLL